MTKEQFSAALAIARSDRDLSTVDDSILYGCGLSDFQPVTVTIEPVAKMLRWQCLQFNGEIDQNELNNMKSIFRRKVFVV